MSDVIANYQKWKQEGEDLRVKAKQAMEGRFRELLLEAIRISEEYRADFGGVLKPPPSVTTFRFKAPAKSKAKKAAPAKAGAKAKAPEPKPEAKPVKIDPAVTRLAKRLETAKKKLDDAKTAGTATRVLEDKVYEIEDELRLANQRS